MKGEQMNSDQIDQLHYIDQLRHEVTSRRIDSEQLQRICDAITKATPNFSCAFGGPTDHAEAALAALVAERDALKAALARIYNAYGDYFTDAPECADSVATLSQAILDGETLLKP